MSDATFERHGLDALHETGGQLPLIKIEQQVSNNQGVSPRFVKLLQKCIASHGRKALDFAVEALQEAINPVSITITSKCADDTFRITGNYRDGHLWMYRLNEEPPSYSLTRAIERSGKPMFWRLGPQPDEQRVSEHENWFLFNDFLGVPILSPTENKLIATFVMGFEDSARCNDESATIAGIVASAYAMALEHDSLIDKGIDIGRTIEQARMLQKLHDTTVQDIFACECIVSELLDSASRDTEAHPKLKELLSLLRRSNQSLRAILASTRDSYEEDDAPKMVDEIIERVIAAHTRQGGCPVACIVDKGLAASPALSDTLESIVGESLANIRKHAQAQHAIVSCTSVDETLYLGIHDDGIGLPPNCTSTHAGARLHFGIRNMRDLAEKLNGSFEVGADQESGGTYVRVRIPLAQGVIADE